MNFKIIQEEVNRLKIKNKNCLRLKFRLEKIVHLLAQIKKENKLLQMKVQIKFMKMHCKTLQSNLYNKIRNSKDKFKMNFQEHEF